MDKLRRCSVAITHFLATIPLYSRRSHLIAGLTGASVSEVSVISSSPGIDIHELEKQLEVIIKAPASCGVCAGNEGEYIEAGTCSVFTRVGRRRGIMFHFKCDICSALCGQTTCALNNVDSVHVLSKHILKAQFFAPVKKPHERSDQMIAYSRDLLEELEVDMATIKTVESFVLKYNILLTPMGEVPLNEGTFRNAYFVCRTFEEGFKFGLLPTNTLVFTKRDSGGDSELERFLEDLTEKQTKAFSEKWCMHDESLCGKTHKLVVFDGHANLHTECCQNRNCTAIHHDALDKPVYLACGRWPEYIDGRKMPLCGPCMRTNLVRKGAGINEISRDCVDLLAIPIPEKYNGLIGNTWHDEDDKKQFTLLAMAWTEVDSSLGLQIPVLVGYYAESINAALCALQGLPAVALFEKGAEWSLMSEIEPWICASEKNSSLSERAKRALRRQPIPMTTEPLAEKVGLSNTINTDGFALEDIIERMVHPNGRVVYLASYSTVPGKNGKTQHIKIWEEASVIPIEAIARWKARHKGFAYSKEELELMEKCAGSLKERHKTGAAFSAGIFVGIMNCGTILSISPLVGSESLSQGYMHIVDLFDQFGDYLPKEVAYDDGCHLRRFAELRQDCTPKAKIFWMKVGCRIVVDRFHFRNHKDTHAYCKEHCDPSKNLNIEGANSEICEQSFRWFSRHKYSLNYMSPARFRFIMTILADRRNTIIHSKR